MACLVSFDNVALTGVITGATSTSGIWEYIGYSTTVGGTYGAGGNFPSVTTWGQSVDTSSIITGFYKFKYKADLPPGPCYGEAEYIVPIVQGTTDVGANVALEICSNDAARNIFNDSGLFDEAAVLPVVSALGGAGISSPGYNAGGAGITDDTYDPTAEASYPQTIVFEITYTPTPPATYSISACDNCVEKILTITYTVTESFVLGTPALIASCNDGDV